MRKMFSKILIFFFLVTLSLGIPIGERIVNGTDAAQGEFPYIVSLRVYNSHNCGASILNELFLLTAAHCVIGFDVKNFNIQFGLTQITPGTTGVNIINVAKILVHEDYKPGKGYYNDVAVVKLATPLKYDKFVQPTILPPALNATPELSPAELIGWGTPYSGGPIMKNLQKVQIMVFSDADCERIHSSTGPTNREYHICAGVPEGGKGQCSGDSGGPLTVNGVQVGIVSWSVKPCTVRGYPGVFTKVSKHISWILKQIKDNSV